MGKTSPGGVDLDGRATDYSITATGRTVLGVRSGQFNVSAWGGSGTFAILRSFDGGDTFLNCSLPDGSANSFAAPFSLSPSESEPGVIYAVDCTAYASGPIKLRG